MPLLPMLCRHLQSRPVLVSAVHTTQSIIESDNVDQLDQSNFLLWKNLALPILRSYILEGHLTDDKSCPPETIEVVAPETIVHSEGSSSGTSRTTVMKTNPNFEAWAIIDQLILGWLYNSMTHEVATQVMGFIKEKTYERLFSLYLAYNQGLENII